MLDSDKKFISDSFNDLLLKLNGLPKNSLKTIRNAFEYAAGAHEGIRRKSGEPYILHPLSVAHILVDEMGLEDPVSVTCALLHDVVEDTSIELITIEREFGPVIANIIDGLTKISGSIGITEGLDQLQSAQAENFRKVLLTISDDIRVVLIKLADRLHNMRTLGAMKREKALKITSETLYIYAPLAHRLGLYEIKSELEDLSFKHSEPQVYDEINEKLTKYKKDAEEYINDVISRIDEILKPMGIPFNIKKRYKSIYSIYSKMQRKDLPFEEIYDLYAIRIILDTKDKHDCWNVYSLISGLYTPSPKRIRDWITVPKANGYESLHTTLMGPEGKWVEVQIRTNRMDEVAEKGIAAHWKYKENGEVMEDFYTEWIGQVRNILQNPSLDALEALRAFKEKLQPDDVFVFTPKGEMIRLPINATVLDFAYKIHSQLGDTAIGAKVNNQVETLDLKLRPGDQVEILTSRNQHPQEDWLRFVQTERARNGIKNYLKKFRKERIEKGRKIFERQARRYNIDENHPYIKELLAYFMAPDIDEFYFRLGNHQLNIARLEDFIKLKQAGEEIDSEYILAWERTKRMQEKRLEEQGVDPDALITGAGQNIDSYILAKCCGPVRGDDILAFEENGHMVIHRTSCPRAIELMSSHGDRIIRSMWRDESNSMVSFLSAIKVVGLDKQGILFELVRLITMKMKLNISKVSIESHGGLFEGIFHLYVKNTSELKDIMDRMKQISNIFTASRVSNKVEVLQFEKEPPL